MNRSGCHRLVVVLLVVLGFGRAGAAAGAVDDAPARLIASQPVEIPPRARLNGLHGTSVVEFVVNRRANAEDVLIVESAGHDLLDAAAAYAVSQWKFAPATPGGRPVRRKVRQKMIIEPASPPEREALRERLAEERRIKVKGHALTLQALRRTPEKGKVTLLVTLGPDGLVNWLKIEKTSGIPKLDYLAAAAVYDDMAFDLETWTGRKGRSGSLTDVDLDQVRTNVVYRIPFVFPGIP